MALKAILDTLDGVDPLIAAEYVEFDAGNGVKKFRLDIDGVRTHPEVTALSNALRRTQGELTTAKTERDAATGRLEGLPEEFDLSAYEALKAQADGKPGAQNEETIRTQATEAATQRAERTWKPKFEKAETDATKFRKLYEGTLRDKALNEALDKANVTDPAYRRAARALLSPSIKIHEEGEDLVPIANDTDLGDMPVTDFVRTWAGTDEGKRFVAPSGSGGGDANGGPAGGKTTDDNPFKPGKSFNRTKQAQLLRENPTLAAKFQREAATAAAA